MDSAMWTRSSIRSAQAWNLGRKTRYHVGCVIRNSGWRSLPSRAIWGHTIRCCPDKDRSRKLGTMLHGVVPHISSNDRPNVRIRHLGSRSPCEVRVQPTLMHKNKKPRQHLLGGEESDGDEGERTHCRSASWPTPSSTRPNENIIWEMSWTSTNWPSRTGSSAMVLGAQTTGKWYKNLNIQTKVLFGSKDILEIL